MIDTIRILFVAAMTIIAFIPGVSKTLNGAGIDKTDLNIVRLAFLLTFISDIFILVLSMNFVAVSFFCFVHVIYFYRHMRILKKPVLGMVLLAFAGLSVLLINIFYRNLYLVSGVYAVCLIPATVSSWFVLKADTEVYKINSFMMFLGMACFFVCDVFIAVYNLTAGLVSEMALHLAWIFYVPALILLALSPKKWRSFSMR